MNKNPSRKQQVTLKKIKKYFINVKNKLPDSPLLSRLVLESSSFFQSRRRRAFLLCLILALTIFFRYYVLKIKFKTPSFNIRVVQRSSGSSTTSMSDSITLTDAAPSRQGKNVAIVIAGTLQRFQLNATIHHLLKPLIAQGYAAEYYISLTTAYVKSYRDDKSYMSHVHWDPIFSNGTVLKKRPSDELVSTMIRRQITKSGGIVRQLVLRDSIDLEKDGMLKKRRKMALKKYPKEDPDLRFPLLDLRNDLVQKRTISGNRSILRLMLANYELWKALVQVESNLKFQYDYVMFLRDDTLWLQDFDFNGLTRDHQNQKSGNSYFDAFALSCDARVPPLEASEMNDHGIIVRRDKAKLFGDYYSELFKTDLDACAKRLPRSLRQEGKRGCNSEMLLKFIVDQHKLKVHKVGQAEIPFQRSLNVARKDGTIGKCFHKVCQSRKNKLGDHGIKMCTDLAF